MRTLTTVLKDLATPESSLTLGRQRSQVCFPASLVICLSPCSVWLQGPVISDVSWQAPVREESHTTQNITADSCVLGTLEQPKAGEGRRPWRQHSFPGVGANGLCAQRVGCRWGLGDQERDSPARSALGPLRKGVVIATAVLAAGQQLSGFVPRCSMPAALCIHPSLSACLSFPPFPSLPPMSGREQARSGASTTSRQGEAATLLPQFSYL